MMAAEQADLTKVDSAVAGLSTSPPKDKAAKKDKSAKDKSAKDKSAKDKDAKTRKASTDTSNVRNINDLEKEGIELKIAKETQKLNWKLNTSPASLEEPVTMKKLLTDPPVKKIDLHFPLGLEVTARNLKGVTIKDALDAIYKQYKKRSDDELGDTPILAGFEWDKEESWTRLVVHQKKEGAPAPKKKSKKGE